MWSFFLCWFGYNNYETTFFLQLQFCFLSSVFVTNATELQVCALNESGPVGVMGMENTKSCCDTYAMGTELLEQTTQLCPNLTAFDGATVVFPLVCFFALT